MNKALLFFLASFLSVCLNAQNASFNTYNFGEGLEFVSDDEHSFKLGGYIQPMLESRLIFNDTLNENYNDNRFRMRRLRVRLSGKSPSNNIGYRIQFDLSGVSETGEESSNLLLDAFVEISETGLAEGCQDLGAGGILCATTEVIKRGREKTKGNLGCCLLYTSDAADE